MKKEKEIMNWWDSLNFKVEKIPKSDEEFNIKSNMAIQNSVKQDLKK